MELTEAITRGETKVYQGESVCERVRKHLIESISQRIIIWPCDNQSECEQRSFWG